MTQSKLKSLSPRERDAMMRVIGRTDPLFWLQYRFGQSPKSVRWTDWPGYEDHAWDGTPNPLAGAWESLARKRWAAVFSGTSVSKTYSLADIVFWFLDCFEDAYVVTTGPTERQLEKQLWAEIAKKMQKFKAIRPYAELQYLNLYCNRAHPRFGSTWNALGFSTTPSAGSDSAGRMQGIHRENLLVIVEECPVVSQAVINALVNTCSASNNLMLCVGNPDSPTDALSDFAKNNRVDSYTVSALDFPNVVIGSEVVPGAVTRQHIEMRRERYGENSSLFLSRVRGRVPKQSAESLIRYEWLEWCCPHKPAYKALRPDQLPTPDGGWKAAGIDVANSENGDKAAVALGDGNRLYYLNAFQCPNALTMAHNLIKDAGQLDSENRDDYHTPNLLSLGFLPSFVGVDGAGIGPTLINPLHDMGYAVVSLQGGQLEKALPVDDISKPVEDQKPLYQFVSLRAQMYYELAMDLRDRKIILDFDDSKLFDELAAELTVLKVEPREGRIALTPKKKVKEMLNRSPDLADSVAYWNWVRKGYYLEGIVGEASILSF